METSQAEQCTAQYGGPGHRSYPYLIYPNSPNETVLCHLHLPRRTFACLIHNLTPAALFLRKHTYPAKSSMSVHRNAEGITVPSLDARQVDTSRLPHGCKFCTLKPSLTPHYPRIHCSLLVGTFLQDPVPCLATLHHLQPPITLNGATAAACSKPKPPPPFSGGYRGRSASSLTAASMASRARCTLDCR